MDTDVGLGRWFQIRRHGQQYQSPMLLPLVFNKSTVQQHTHRLSAMIRVHNLCEDGSGSTTTDSPELVPNVKAIS